MSRVPLIILLGAVLFLPMSCKQNGSNATADAKSHALNVLLDTTATLSQINEVIFPWADSLKASAVDTASLNARLSAQQFAFMTIQLLTEQAARMEKAGNPIPHEDLNRMMSPLLDAACQWLYSTIDGIPSIWRDMFYVSNQKANEPVDGYFHIMVLLPSEEMAEPELHIFFPESAADMPALLFRKYSSLETLEEDADNQELIPLEDWYKKGELEDGYPVYASAGADIVKRMLEYDLMYVLFRSGPTPNGEAGENEMARIDLMYFQNKYSEVLGFD